jgi:hypothetical protein
MVVSEDVCHVCHEWLVALRGASRTRLVDEAVDDPVKGAALDMVGWVRY